MTNSSFPLSRFLSGDRSRMLLVAALIGLAAGLAVIVFRECLEGISRVVLGRGAAFLGIHEGGVRILFLPLLPMLGALLLIPLSLAFPGEVNGYGLPNFLLRVNLGNGVFKARTVPLKLLASALCIGTGNSAGIEGPSAQIGGTLGSLMGRGLRVSGKRMKAYIAAGCAGAIAGIFNAPLAGIFFATEIVLQGAYGMSSFSALVIASAMGTAVSRSWFGDAPIFAIPPYATVNLLTELPLYALMACCLGVASAVHIRLFYFIRDFFAKLRLPGQLKPVFGAFLVGLLALYCPAVMGDGYKHLELALSGALILPQLLLYMALKPLATSITLGSGGAGGAFAPALFTGAMLGGAFGVAVHTLFPAYTAAPGAYATVGAGAFLAAMTHAPLTAIFLLFEMTGNYMIIVPVMLSTVLGIATARHLCGDSIDTVDFTRKGIYIREGLETNILKSLKVGQALSEDVAFISESANINQLLELFRDTKNHFYFPVINQKGLMVGVVSLQDVKGALLDDSARSSCYVGDICARDVIMLSPSASLYEAVGLFDVKDIDEIPVVESLAEPWVLGMLKRQDLRDAYNRELLQRGIKERAKTIRLSQDA